jgi:mannose-6-phosphate isomerase class I/broad specificity phosphatase PhoE
MTRLIFVRHGESAANLARVFAGQTNAPLTEKGHTQAVLTGEYLAAHYQIDVAYGSDLQRAYDTACHVAAQYNIPVRPEPAFREIYAGEWENRPFDEVAVVFEKDWQTWRQDIGHSRCTAGESFAELQARVCAAAKRIAARHEGQTVLIGTHATPIRALECAWRKVGADGAKDVPFVANASVTVVEYEGDDVRILLRGYNEHHGELGTGLPRSIASARYPMKLTCIPKERIWGGDTLKTAYKKQADGIERLGETWELTVRPDGMSHVQNGSFAGKTLADAIAALGNAAVAPAYTGGTFPLLIKLIDAREKLSVQVHPDDDYAARVEGDVGKTEMWYVLAAEKGATLVSGLRPGVDRAAFAAAVREGRTEEVLLTRPVHAGDVCFIPSGLVHAIGAGIVVAEIQQNSDLTYRVFDYNRRQSDGSLRELHVDRALDVVRPFSKEEIEAIRFEARDEQDDAYTLVHCRYFRTRLLAVNGEREETVTPESFVSLLCVEGEGEIVFDGMPYPIQKGEQYFLPADMGAYILRGSMTLLSASV